jgi:hypothetical protein
MPADVTLVRGSVDSDMFSSSHSSPFLVHFHVVYPEPLLSRMEGYIEARVPPVRVLARSMGRVR